MRTRFWKLSALVLALLLALTGCSLIEIDEEMDMAEVVAEVGGTKISKGDVIDAYNYQVAYTTYLYNAYLGVTELTSEQLDSVKDSVLDAYIEQELLRQKAEELALTDFSDESFAEADAEAETYFEELIAEYNETVDISSLSEEEARDGAVEYLSSQGVTLDGLKENYRNNAISDLVYNHVIESVEVTDDEVQALYDEQVAKDESTYSSSRYLFELYNTYDGYTITWAPEGYRTVKHILFKLTDEQTAALDELNTQLSDVEEAIDALNTDDESDASEEEAAEGESEATEPAKTLDELTAEKADLEQQIADKKAEILESFKERTDSVYARLEAGESFDALVAELGEDPGMQSEPSMSKGYYVSADSSMWDVTFRDTAMALKKVGDVSDPILTSSGVHIIYYQSDVTPGAVDIETVRDALTADALEDKQEAVYDEQLNEWKDAANVKKYPKVLS